MWSIYFENVIDIAEVLNAKNNLKLLIPLVLRIFFLSGCFFSGAVFYVYVRRGLS